MLLRSGTCSPSTRRARTLHSSSASVCPSLWTSRLSTPLTRPSPPLLVPLQISLNGLGAVVPGALLPLHRAPPEHARAEQHLPGGGTGTALIRVSCFLSSSPPRLGCGHWLAPLSPCPQEARGLSAVAGRGGHGPDARARLEVCVHIHSGILSLPGPEGAGKNQKVVAHFHPPWERW